jgi:hypothetical protein
MPQVLEWKKDNMLGILKLEIDTITAERFSSMVALVALLSTIIKIDHIF